MSAVVVDAVRTPIGKRTGGQWTLYSADLLVTTLKALVQRSGVEPEDIDQIVGGGVLQVGKCRSYNITTRTVGRLRSAHSVRPAPA
jgi:acetyl-CoA C-acetyltransferase